MNWELLGSAGVLIKLIYLGVQLRRSQVSTQNASIFGMQMAHLTANDQRLQHAELLTKANADTELTGAAQARNFARFL